MILKPWWEIAAPHSDVLASGVVTHSCIASWRGRIDTTTIRGADGVQSASPVLSTAPHFRRYFWQSREHQYGSLRVSVEAGLGQELSPGIIVLDLTHLID